MAYTSRIWIILSLVVSISLGFNVLVCNSNDLLTLSHNSSQPGGGLSSTLGQNLIFVYNETLQESSLQLSFLDLNLSFFNEIKLSFIVNGDQSTSSGLIVTFDFNSTEVIFIIERIYQDSIEHQIYKGFTLDKEILGSQNITVNFQGQAPLGKSGTFTLLAQTSFNKLPIKTLSQEEQELTITPQMIMFEGEMFGSKEYRILTVVENDYNSSFMFIFSVSFSVNDFHSVFRELYIDVNNSQQLILDFNVNDNNYIQSELILNKGMSIIELVFHVDFCSDNVQINDIVFSGYLSEGAVNEDVYYEVNWVDGINELVDISLFKPETTISDQILNLNLYLSFEGTQVYSGIILQIIQDSIVLDSELILMSKQTTEIQSLIFETYTSKFNENLYIKLEAETSGSGKIYIYDATTISVQKIEHVYEQQYQKILEEQIEIDTSLIGSTLIKYYDVVHIEDASKMFNIELSMNLGFSDLSFDSMSVTFLVNRISAFSQNFQNPGILEITKQISLSEGFNEIEVVLSIIGNGASITLEDLEYSIIKTTEEAQQNGSSELIDIPFFKTPKNIAVGLFVLFDCWLLMGIILRIYRGHKLRKRQHTENDEFILEIAQLSQDK